MRLGVALAAVLLLAGCIDEPPPGVPSDPDVADAEQAPDASSPAAGADPVPGQFVVTATTIPIEWSGRLGTFAYACEYQNTGACQGHVVTDGETRWALPLPGLVLDAVTLSLSWTPTGPLHERLAFVVVAVGGCETCEDTVLADFEGGPGLSVALGDLDLLLGAEGGLVAFAYDPMFLVHEPPLVAHANVDAELWASGSVVVETPPPEDA